MLQHLLQKLIKTASGRTRWALAVVGLSVALLLMLSAIQLQVNYNNLLHSKTNQDSVANFLVVNKILNSSTYNNTTLSNADIDQLKQQGFTDDVGILTPSRFKASIQSNSEKFPFYTDIAFESAPASFIDINDKNWTWDENSPYIPMIAPNMFLDFYNFEFSLSQNLPQLTQDIVKMIVFKVNIQSGLSPMAFNGRIIGFSDRISSILVPQEFMDYANASFAAHKTAQPSRVIIRTKDPGSPQLVNYLKEHNLSTDADKTRFSKYRKVVNVVVNASWVTGLVMLLFALLIFTLFIQLTISSCKTEIELLLTLGASPIQLKSFLMKQFFPSNIIITAVALIVLGIVQYFAADYLLKQNMFIPALLSWFTVAGGLIVLLLIWIVYRVSLNKYVKTT